MIELEGFGRVAQIVVSRVMRGYHHALMTTAMFAGSGRNLGMFIGYDGICKQER